MWGVLEGCLGLAGLLIASMSSHPWFDALLNASRTPVPRWRFKTRDLDGYPGDELGKCWKVFQLRSPTEVNGAETKKRMDVLEEVSKRRLRFGFMDRRVHPMIGEMFDENAENELEGEAQEGRTMADGLAHFAENMKVFISYQAVAPLLRGDLSDGERMAER